jgi:hypothetical protein
MTAEQLATLFPGVLPGRGLNRQALRRHSAGLAITRKPERMMGGDVTVRRRQPDIQWNNLQPRLGRDFLSDNQGMGCGRVLLPGYARRLQTLLLNGRPLFLGNQMHPTHRASRFHSLFSIVPSAR